VDVPCRCARGVGKLDSEPTTSVMAEPTPQAPSALSWRERRRSRLAEVADGGAMMFADVAVVRASVVCAALLALAFFARHRSSCAWMLALAACAFLFSEMLNTLVEMLVDRISLEVNVFSARIKHAAAFLSACVGVVASGLALVVLYQTVAGTHTATPSASCGSCSGEAPENCPSPFGLGQSCGNSRCSSRLRPSGSASFQTRAISHPAPTRGYERGTEWAEAERSEGGREAPPSLHCASRSSPSRPQPSLDGADPRSLDALGATPSGAEGSRTESAMALRVTPSGAEGSRTESAKGSGADPRSSDALVNTPQTPSQRSELLPSTIPLHSTVQPVPSPDGLALPTLIPLRWLKHPRQVALRTTRPMKAKREGLREGEFVSRNIKHPSTWTARTTHKRRYRRALG
jgi:diacylglycerol kinase